MLHRYVATFHVPPLLYQLMLQYGGLFFAFARRSAAFRAFRAFRAAFSFLCFARAALYAMSRRNAARMSLIKHSSS